jgi:hypothetical protein
LFFLQLKKPLSPGYFFLSKLQQLLSSPLSILKIHLASRHLFITLVQVKPKGVRLLILKFADQVLADTDRTRAWTGEGTLAGHGPSLSSRLPRGDVAGGELDTSAMADGGPPRGLGARLTSRRGRYGFHVHHSCI